MRISGCHLHQVACFEDIELAFPAGTDPSKADTYIFVGTNGTGKSTLLLSMAQAFSIHAVGLTKRLRSLDSFASTTVDPSATIAIKLRDHSPNPQRLLQIDNHRSLELFEHFSGYAVFGDQSVRQSGSLNEYRHQVHNYQPRGQGHQNTRFSFAAFAYSGQRSINQVQVNAIQELTDSPFANALSFINTANPQQLVQWIANAKAKEAFAFRRGDHEKVRQHSGTITKIESTISTIVGKPFRFAMIDDPLGVCVDYDGVRVDLDVLPDGMKSVLSWIADLLMRLDRIPWKDDVPILERPFALFLDEIEVHLHPAWQRQVLPTIQSLFPKAQIFISTHSPFVVASARDAWIYPLRIRDGYTVCDEAVRAQPGVSYATVLRDILGIDAEFADDVMRDFDQFYEFKRSVLAGNSDQIDGLRSIATRIQSYGVETAAIIGREMAQIQKLLKLENRP